MEMLLSCRSKTLKEEFKLHYVNTELQIWFMNMAEVTVRVQHLHAGNTYDPQS